MFPRAVAALYLFFSLALLAAAMPGGTPPKTTVTVTSTTTVTSPPSSPTGGSCSTGPIQCCNSLENANSAAASLLLGLLGVVVQGVDVLLGLNCSPVGVIGVGGGNCNANVVCCQNNAVGGLISIGCIPVIL